MSYVEIKPKSDLAVYVRILRLPPDKIVEGLDVRRFEVGQTYQVGPRLAELLIRTGHAELERRRPITIDDPFATPE